MTIESFIAGFCYGGTTVFVGQPLDTIKTLQQASPKNGGGKSILQISQHLWQKGGIPAFYRGGMPLLLGGGLMRSAQFGVYDSSLGMIRNSMAPQDRVLGIDLQVAMAGVCGGIGRGLVEGPFEMVKVRRQVQNSWRFKEVMKGTGTTLFRNSFLFAAYVIYMDIAQQQSAFFRNNPFWLGGVCANLAWFTVWPLDVVKSRVQSGQYEGQSPYQILKHVMKKGELFRGLVPGLTRSFIANGISMVVYKWVETELQQRWRQPQPADELEEDVESKTTTISETSSG